MLLNYHPHPLYVSTCPSTPQQVSLIWIHVVTFNIAYGLITGILAMVILKGLPLLVAKISNGHFVPENFENREGWQKPAGGFAPLWMRRLARGDRRFWLPEDGIPSALPSYTKDDSRSSDNGNVAEKDVPPPLHSLPLAGVHHHIDEDPRDEKHDEKHDV